MEEKLRSLRNAMDETVLKGNHFSEEHKIKIRSAAKHPHKIHRFQWFPQLLTVVFFIGCIVFITDLTKQFQLGNSGTKIEEQKNNDGNWEVTPTFSIQLESPDGKFEAPFRGIHGKVAFIDTEFTPNTQVKTRWFFWGKELKEVNKENFKLIGIQKGTGVEKLLIDSKSWEVTNQMYKDTETKTILGAQSSQHTVISLPSVGLWRLDAYIGDKHYGSIVIEVKAAE
ncbi:DUF4871 domain-containing protein [Neobacillus notoginsengisoli]|uniref:DUF4871 domain-containing protein n=1 Tax=Neobacillus notoginsengisoli TaxID=1578198 RepID=A0A417YZJ2_9BACI|nr:DUF4871 domain-containing protein [Neobacillus notoginsengisoli]RHW43313.1 DUF4871 domain-containing protein [Neobacillus notoginsengisoli]